MTTTLTKFTLTEVNMNKLYESSIPLSDYALLVSKKKCAPSRCKCKRYTTEQFKNRAVCYKSGIFEIRTCIDCKRYRLYATEQDWLNRRSQ